jgi:diguanylate cyclase (GGDEF)-like protein/PAS domain S-box-containing protein
MEAPAARSEAVLRAVAFSSERLLRGEGESTSTLHEVLAHLGAAAGVDRSYLFQNVRDPQGRLWMDLRAEWNAPGVRHIFEDPDNHLHPYAPAFAHRIDRYWRGDTVAGLVADLPQSERAIMEPEGVRSVLTVPVFVRDEWWGYIGFDDCTSDRRWSETEMDALRTVAGNLGVYFDRELVARTEALEGDRYRSMIEHGPAISYIDATNENASTIFISGQVERLLGYSPQEWVDDPDLWPNLLHPDDKSRALAENERHNETGEPFRMEYRLFHRDGHIVWVHDEATMMRDDRGVPLFSHGVMMDITDRKAGEENVAFLAYHDELTGLPSRSMFDELLDLSISRARRHEGAVAVIAVDIDDFRLVNDSLGHSTGDEILRVVADRLREASRETDLVARRGGDQFLMLMADLERDTPGDLETAVVRAEAAAQRVLDAMLAPITVEGTELYVSVSLGISLFPQDAGDAIGLQRNAEAAMYESKKSGPGGFAVSARGAFDSSAKLQFVTRLRKAVDSQRWTLHYQPVVELATGRMVGVEALIRWIEPDGTMVPPNQFIPLAEELGLIEVIGDWVVRELVYQARAWQELDIGLEIGFNLSPRQFRQPDLSDLIISRVVDVRIDTAAHVVQITEGSAIMYPDPAQKIH